MPQQMAVHDVCEYRLHARTCHKGVVLFPGAGADDSLPVVPYSAENGAQRHTGLIK